MLWCEVSEDFFPRLANQVGLTPSKSSESSHQDMQNAPKGANIGKTLRFGADFSLIEHPSACTGAGALSQNVPKVRTKRRRKFPNSAPDAGKVHEVRTSEPQVFPNFAPNRSWSKDMVRTLGTFTASCCIVFILPCLCRFRHQQEGEAKAVEEMPEDEYRPLRIGCRCARMDVRIGDMGKVRTSGRYIALGFP